jgi:sec-independent protein translocase protein TatA
MFNSVFLFLNLGGGEIFLVVLFIVMFFGSDKLPEIAKGLGKGIREINDAKAQIQNEIQKSTSGFREELEKHTSDIQSEITKASDGMKKQIETTANTVQQEGKVISDTVKEA